jgi:GNAT superfamily N-acetyltransferase
MSDLARRIAQAYRWHRRLGAETRAGAHGCFVVDVGKPESWDTNHVDEVTASAAWEIDAVLSQMETHYAHSPWRVAHTDGFTPQPFLARLAFEGFEARFLTIQMALPAHVPLARPPVDLRPVASAQDWRELHRLVRLNHEEGRTTEAIELPPEFTAEVIESYRDKAPETAFHLVIAEGAAVAYGACAMAPNGLGMIEDIFTHPAHRRRGLAGGMIADFVAGLRGRGCDAVFLGALAAETAKRLYADLGFAPVSLSQTWVRSVT